MANPDVKTALVKCSFGDAPAPLQVTSQFTVKICGMEAATIMDNKPLMFGTCKSPAHPQMASTGVPGPCMAAAQVTAPWTLPSMTVMVCGKPLITKDSMLMCNFGGIIQTSMTPAMTVKIGK